VLHAPRQTGKTTFLQNWAREINAGNEAVACYVSVERCQGVNQIAASMPAICEAIKEYTASSQLAVPEPTTTDTVSILSNTLYNWAALVAPKPLIVLFDEVDVLQGETMISFLRQLRGGFAGRGVGTFPTSIALVGMRDLKDYITAAKDGIAPNPGSPFNIKEDSAMIGNFTQENVAHLFAQRTAEVGQQITQEALDYVWEQSNGQPWIVNSLFKRATMRVLDEDSTETVAIDHIRKAREQMVLARETHLDALAYRLDNPQVRRVIETLMTGEPDPQMADSEGFRLAQDLGLVVVERGTPQVANPMYRETLARQMTYGAQLAIPEQEWQWQKPDGSLDMDALLHEFQDFWQANSEEWEEKSDYTEAFPHLLLMAFLQRVTNGGGRIEREYAAGRGRMDLAVEYSGKWNILEIKLRRKKQTFEWVKEKGLVQIRKYRDRFPKTESTYLIIFDRRPEAATIGWSEKIRWEQEGDVTVVGC
jgi:hypothetical protein